MTKEQINALITLIDAMIDEKIADAFGRDSGNEWRARYAAEVNARAVLAQAAGKIVNAPTIAIYSDDITLDDIMADLNKEPK